VAATAGENLDIENWKARIDAAFEPYDDFVTYREAGGWASGVGEVIDVLADLIDVGPPDGVIGLAEYAHRRADEAVSYVDDSDGWLSGISEHLGELHHRACVAGSPDPVALAGRLVELELTSELDAFHRAALRWADVLGSDGIDEYRRLVEPRFVELDPDASWSEGFAVRQARIGVALAAQDPDELIAVYRNQLNTPDAYLEVTRALAASERKEEAIEWARSGLEVFADRSWQTPPLRDFLAGLLRSDGATDQAMQLYWDAFQQHPSLEAYRRLGAEAATAGSDTEWPARAVEWLQSQLDDGDVRDARALVEILLYEGDDQAAWETARRHGCDQRLWLTLARTREEDHPLDAVEVYEREVYTQIDTKKNRGYKTTVELLGRIRRLTDQTGQPDQFKQLVVAVRAEHGRKRNLMALIEKEGW
jgi:tetratricopeptide (TPR) repeat protein